MIAATAPVQRAPDAKLLVVDAAGRFAHQPRAGVLDVLRPGDLVVANDAATMPASLVGRHLPSRRSIEVRLAGRESLDRDAVRSFVAVLFGPGDYRMRTEDRPAPPPVAPGDRLALGTLVATVTARLHDHPRLVRLEFDGPPAAIWEGIARCGRPVQYSHVPQALALWDTWTPIAGAPVAFEPPSAGFVLDWQMLEAMRRKGIEFMTLTHAAGLSSTGDGALDALLPFDEPYRITERTADAVRRARRDGRRLVAIGTTVVRALEHAARRTGIVRSGDGLATGRIGASTRLRVVDALLSGTHERGTSHFELLRAFADDETLERVELELDAGGYRTHEFGDSIVVERQALLRKTARGSGILRACPRHSSRISGASEALAMARSLRGCRREVCHADCPRSPGCCRGPQRATHAHR
jgi:S-adenosylmethionine:tRNA ribosyltransferase-isomerase